MGDKIAILICILGIQFSPDDKKDRTPPSTNNGFLMHQLQG